MPKARIQKETREETVLREYRHLRKVIAEERDKLAYLDGRLEQLRQKRKNKQAVIKANEAAFEKLRKQAAKIVAEMLEEEG